MAHTFDTSLYTDANTSNPITFNYTCGTGVTLLVVGIYTATTARAGTQPLYGGKSFTDFLGRVTFDYGDGAGELWYLQNPSTGSAYSISIPNTAGATNYIRTSSYKAGAGNTTVYDTSVWVNNTSGAINASSNIAATANGMVVQLLAGESNYVYNVFTHNPLFPVDHGTHNSYMQYGFIGSTATVNVGAINSAGDADEYVLITAALKELGAIPYVPVLSSPANNATGVNTDTSIIWAAATAGPTAASYIVQVCKNTDFIVNDVSEAGVTNLYYNLIGLSNTTDYYWKVAATNATGNSAYASYWKFTTKSTTSVKSINNVDNANVMSVSNVVRANVKSISNVT